MSEKPANSKPADEQPTVPNPAPMAGGPEPSTLRDPPTSHKRSHASDEITTGYAPSFRPPVRTERTTTDAEQKIADDAAPGRRLGDFQIISRLGAGAFATVYLAEQVSLGRLVALKVSADRGTEARTMASLEH